MLFGVPLVALALKYAIPIWSNDLDFEIAGVQGLSVIDGGINLKV